MSLVGVRRDKAARSAYSADRSSRSVCYCCRRRHRLRDSTISRSFRGPQTASHRHPDHLRRKRSRFGAALNLRSAPIGTTVTDLLHAAVTKSFGTLVHGYTRTVDWRVVRRLGALPYRAGRWCGAPRGARLVRFAPTRRWREMDSTFLPGRETAKPRWGGIGWTGCPENGSGRRRLRR
jgi:hypothetical protein